MRCGACICDNIVGQISVGFLINPLRALSAQRKKPNSPTLATAGTNPSFGCGSCTFIKSIFRGCACERLQAAHSKLFSGADESKGEQARKQQESKLMRSNQVRGLLSPPFLSLVVANALWRLSIRWTSKTSTAFTTSCYIQI